MCATHFFECVLTCEEWWHEQFERFFALTCQSLCLLRTSKTGINPSFFNSLLYLCKINYL